MGWRVSVLPQTSARWQGNGASAPGCWPPSQVNQATYRSGHLDSCHMEDFHSVRRTAWGPAAAAEPAARPAGHASWSPCRSRGWAECQIITNKECWRGCAVGVGMAGDDGRRRGPWLVSNVGVDDGKWLRRTGGGEEGLETRSTGSAAKGTERDL
jgi:hypothetical protein